MELKKEYHGDNPLLKNVYATISKKDGSDLFNVDLTYKLISGVRFQSHMECPWGDVERTVNLQFDRLLAFITSQNVEEVVSRSDVECETSGETSGETSEAEKKTDFFEVLFSEDGKGEDVLEKLDNNNSENGRQKVVQEFSYASLKKMADASMEHKFNSYVGFENVVFPAVVVNGIVKFRCLNFEIPVVELSTPEGFLRLQKQISSDLDGCKNEKKDVKFNADMSFVGLHSGSGGTVSVGNSYSPRNRRRSCCQRVTPWCFFIED